MEKTSENNVGEAYAFFYYEGKKEEIEKELPGIRKECKSPLEMELSLSELDHLDTKDSVLSKAKHDANEAGMNYVLKAALPNESNEKTASYLGDVGNEFYNQLHKGNKDNFYFDIVYKQGDELFSRNVN